MKKLTLLTLSLILMTSFAALAGAGHGHEEEKKHVEENEPEHDDHGDHEEKEEEGHGEHGHGDGGEEEEEGSIEISPQAMKEAGIIVEELVLQDIENEIRAPGEIKLNLYLSSKVTPRITAQVVARHVRMGNKVTKREPLITLSSVQVAQAVGELLIAHKEWERVKELGKAAVSAKRYNEATIARTQAKAKVIAYGVSDYQLEELYKEGSDTPGRFYLLAPQDGTIISDDFIVGEMVEAGRVLFNIVNEDVLWVESKLSPKQANLVKIGAVARVHVPDNGWLQGKVVQKHHMLDEETRTIGVRIEVSNEGDKLHPGMFVDSKIQTGSGGKYLAIPTQSVLRSSDGDWVVFVEQEERGAFKPVEIQVVRSVKGYTVIRGIPEGSRVVTSGAFFVQSELAKSGFSVHNH